MFQSAKVASFWCYLALGIIIVCTWLNIFQGHSQSLFRLKSFLLIGPKSETEQFQQSPFNFFIDSVKRVTVIFPVLNQDVPGTFDDGLILSFCQGTGDGFGDPFQQAHKINRNLRLCTQKWGRNGMCETVAALVLLVLVVGQRVDQMVGHHILDWGDVGEWAKVFAWCHDVKEADDEGLFVLLLFCH